MADTPEKLKPVQIRSPEMVRDRTGDIRINQDKAHSVIALLLREAKMQSGDANALASRICDRLKANMPTPARTALRNHRLIDEYPSDTQRTQLLAALRTKGVQVASADWSTAQDIWGAVYQLGQPVADDIVA